MVLRKDFTDDMIEGCKGSDYAVVILAQAGMFG